MIFIIYFVHVIDINHLPKYFMSILFFRIFFSVNFQNFTNVFNHSFLLRLFFCFIIKTIITIIIILVIEIITITITIIKIIIIIIIIIILKPNIIPTMEFFIFILFKC
jgi:hypothetical protein